ncbi:MAG: glutathione S-transferase family protein [Alphaproteobacteria bacterium]|nr:MAG: glutathione S-transferase family protein [Alphaproteobacteria bacterium]
MGKLVDGIWHDVWYDTKKDDGKFVRKGASFRNWVTSDGAPGPTGTGGFKAEAGRYHLYVSLACPWAHRTLIFRTLMGLEDLIDVTIVEPLMLENGWEFGSLREPLFQAKFLHEIYTRAKPDYSGRVTVPVLWDKKQGTIVSNESADIIRMFNAAFNQITGNSLDLWPEDLHAEIEEINQLIYTDVNNGVYQCGFATTQDAYEEAYDALFGTLHALEDRLSRQRYLLGARPTEADIRLFTTLIRFESVYVGHFKCNQQRLADFPNLWNYMLEIYAWAGVADTVDIEHTKTHYYGSQKTINPTGVVPKGPAMGLDYPHDRVRFDGVALSAVTLSAVALSAVGG